MNNNRYILKLDGSQSLKLSRDVFRQAGWHPFQRLYVWVEGQNVLLSPCDDLCRWCGQDDPEQLIPVGRNARALICEECLLKATESKARKGELEEGVDYIRREAPDLMEQIEKKRMSFRW